MEFSFRTLWKQAVGFILRSFHLLEEISMIHKSTSKVVRPCAYLIKHHAINMHEGVDVLNLGTILGEWLASRPRHFTLPGMGLTLPSA
jgi:hypothetical protein